MKRFILFVLISNISSVALDALEPIALFPGIAAVWKDSETIPRPGFSLKGFPIKQDGGIVQLTAFELRAFVDTQDGTSQIDIVWPGIFGIIYPGVSLEISEDQVIPWFFGEVDLFYFPFLFMASTVFERPWFIPSVYVGPRFGATGVGWNLGVRISIPLGGFFDE